MTRVLVIGAVIWCGVSILTGIGFALVGAGLKRLDDERSVVAEAERILAEADQ